LGDRVFKTGIMRSHSYGSDGYGKAAIADKSRPYGATHHPHRIFGTVGNTADPSPDAHALQNGRGKLMALAQSFRFLGIVLYGFLQYQLILILSRSFWQIRPTKWGSPDCSSLLESGIIITVSNELQPKLSL